jgi:hypothetical protein
MNWYKIAKQSNIMQWLDMMIMNGAIARTKLPGTKYRHPDQFFKEHGKFFESQPLTAEEEEEVRNSLGNVSRYQMKECFYNAQVVAQRSNLAYVEGYCFSGMIPIQHAWNSINGKVVDVTLKHQNDGKVIAGIFPQGWEYFGVDFPVREITKMWAEHEMSYPIISYEMKWDYLQRNHPEDPNAPEEEESEQIKKMRELMGR